MKNERFEECRLNDSTVHSFLEAGSGAEELIIALVAEKKALLHRITELVSIAPRKISHGGMTYVWHCPDELIPEEKV